MMVSSVLTDLNLTRNSCFGWQIDPRTCFGKDERVFSSGLRSKFELFTTIILCLTIINHVQEFVRILSNIALVTPQKHIMCIA
jgi:hypothetical protein